MLQTLKDPPPRACRPKQICSFFTVENQRTPNSSVHMTFVQLGFDVILCSVLCSYFPVLCLIFLVMDFKLRDFA